VVERISQEAERSSIPLDDGERHFLNHLPIEPTNPTAAIASGFNTTHECFWPTPVLRDFRYERLCKLAKDARLHDIQTRPDSVREWKFAAAVLLLHHHPMSWLLGWAGIRTTKRSQLRDRLLLVATAAFVVLAFLLGVLALSMLTNGRNDVWKWMLWIVGGCAYGALMTLLYFTVRRLEVRQQERIIENYRHDLPVRGHTHMHR
jgi:hypothetical protein